MRDSGRIGGGCEDRRRHAGWHEKGRRSPLSLSRLRRASYPLWLEKTLGKNETFES